MISTIMLGLFSVLFAFLAKYKNTRWGLKVSFTLIFLFLALRYNFGNDYHTYLKDFIRIGSYDLIFLSDFLLKYEPGWILLNWLFKDLGFFAMVAVLALFSCVVYYRFITKYVPNRYYWLAIFLYMFYPDFMLVHSSAMRQSVAIMFFIFSMDYLYKKDLIRYFLCIGLASLFHYTALILVPVYLLAFFNQKIRLLYGIIFIALFVSLFLFGESLSPYLKLFISNVHEKYEFYQDKGVVNTGLGFLYYSGLFILVLYFERFQNREIGLIFKITAIFFILLPLSLMIEMLSRLGMYFAPAVIIAYPTIFMSLKKPTYKTMFVTIILTVTIFQFFQFFYSDTYKSYFGTYQTIFSAQQGY